jgi:hypothetical protein
MNIETYSESAKGIRITRQRALQELVRHGLTLESLDGFERDEFEGLFNSDRKCNASQLLEWLGY